MLLIISNCAMESRRTGSQEKKFATLRGFVFGANFCNLGVNLAYEFYIFVIGPAEALHRGKHISIFPYNHFMSDYTLAASILNIKMYALALIRHLTQNGPTILVGEPSNKQPGKIIQILIFGSQTSPKNLFERKAKFKANQEGMPTKKQKTFPCILYIFLNTRVSVFDRSSSAILKSLRNSAQSRRQTHSSSLRVSLQILPLAKFKHWMENNVRSGTVNFALQHCHVGCMSIARYIVRLEQ